MLFFDIDDDDAWLNVYVIVRYKVKHKNMLLKKKQKRGKSEIPPYFLFDLKSIFGLNKQGKEGKKERIIIEESAHHSATHRVAAAYIWLQGISMMSIYRSGV